MIKIKVKSVLTTNPGYNMNRKEKLREKNN